MYAIIYYKENKKAFITYFTTFKAANDELNRPFGKYSDYRELRFKDLYEKFIGFSKIQLESVDDWNLIKIKINKGGK